MAEEAASVPNFMATPMTDLSNVTYNSDMRLRMESFIMGLQYDLCKALEAEEVGGQTFRVDRWKKIKKATVQHLQKLLNQEAKFENQSLFMVYGHRWSREEGGGGVTCIIQDGDTFEKVFLSHIF